MINSAITSASKNFIDAGLTSCASKVDRTVDFGEVMAKQAGTRTDDARETTKVDKVKSNDTKVERKTETKAVNSDKKVEEASKDVDKDVEEAVKEAATEIIGAIKDLLGASDEDIEQAMEVLGLSMVDILKPGNVLKLIMQVTGENDPMSVITSSELGSGLKDILSMLETKLEQIKSEFGMTEQELGAAIEDISMFAEEVSQEMAVKDETFSDKELVDVDVVSDETTEDVIASKITVNNSSESDLESDNESSLLNQGKKEDVAATGLAQADEGTVEKTFTQQMTQTFETIFTSEGQEVRVVDVVRQVVDSIKLTTTQTLQRIEIQLNPENLGKVDVQVSLREGLLTAHITTEDEQVRRAIESQMSTLKETFEAQGLKVESVEVSVRSNAFDANSQFNGQASEEDTTSKARKRINLEELLGNDDDEIELSEQVRVTNENSSVEFTA